MKSSPERSNRSACAARTSLERSWTSTVPSVVTTSRRPGRRGLWRERPSRDTDFHFPTTNYEKYLHDDGARTATEGRETREKRRRELRCADSTSRPVPSPSW